MKDELINAIQPNCLIPFTLMALWLDSVVLPNDSTGAVRQQIKTGLRSNGALTQSSWELLINNVQFGATPPINKNTALQWIATNGNPTCSQLKIFINTFEVGAMQYFKVMYPVLDLVELNIKTGYQNDYQSKVWNKRISHVLGGNEIQMNIMLMQLYISNWDLIKDCKPYLVLERYLPKKANGQAFVQAPNDPEVFNPKNKARKSGWKRDRTLMHLGKQYYDGWSQDHVLITETNMYRPNFIPLTAKYMTLDIYAENYVRQTIKGNKAFKFISGNTNKMNNNERLNIKVPMRARIGAMVNGKEIFSKPLIYFSIFAKVMSSAQGREVQIQFGE